MELAAGRARPACLRRALLLLAQLLRTAAAATAAAALGTCSCTASISCVMTHPQNARGDSITVSNDATYGGGHRDCGFPDSDIGVAEGSAFSGMSHEQRFEMDIYGFIKISAVLSLTEVEAMLPLFDAMNASKGFGRDPLNDPSMEKLVTHPAILDPIIEMQEGAPRLVSSSTWRDPPATATVGKPRADAGVLHSQRERDRRFCHYSTRPPGRISCNNVVVFVYLDPVYADDGGLCVLPGSHKSMFCRPRNLFGAYGVHSDPGFKKPAPDILPEGLLHPRVEPGDAIIVSEALTHGVIPWTATDRSRRYIRFRYKSGVSYEEHCEAQRGPRQSVAGGGTWGKPWSPDFVERLMPATKALVGGAFEIHDGQHVRRAARDASGYLAS